MCSLKSLNIDELLEKYKDELRIISAGPTPKNIFWPPEPVRNTPISPRENFLRMCRNEKPMFMPIGTDEQMFSPSIFPDAIARALVIDNSDIDTVEMGGLDMFGVNWTCMPDGFGSMVTPGTPLLENIENWESVIKFPDISAWEWERSSKENASLFTGQFPASIWIMSGLFERLISFMDFENAAMALIAEEQQEYVHALFDKLATFYEQLIERIVQHYPVDLLYFHDDWGSQRAPFFSPNTCREMIAPYLKRVIDAAHSHGLLFNFHSCGKIEPMVPVMIECGVDIWRGQYMNDFEQLYKQYGDKIAFGVYYTPPGPQASRDEVVDSCCRFIEDYSTKGQAFPVIYGDDPHPEWYDILYSLSREYFKN